MSQITNRLQKKNEKKSKITLETSFICILLSASRDVYFDKRMACFLSSLLQKARPGSTTEPKPQRKAYHLKDRELLHDF